MKNSSGQEKILQNALASFSKIDPVLYNPFTDSQWHKAVAGYEHSIQPAEDQASGKLRQRFRDLDTASYTVPSTFLSPTAVIGTYLLISNQSAHNFVVILS